MLLLLLPTFALDFLSSIVYLFFFCPSAKTKRGRISSRASDICFTVSPSRENLYSRRTEGGHLNILFLVLIATHELQCSSVCFILSTGTSISVVRYIQLDYILISMRRYFYHCSRAWVASSKLNSPSPTITTFPLWSSLKWVWIVMIFVHHKMNKVKAQPDLIKHIINAQPTKTQSYFGRHSKKVNGQA